MLNDGKKLVFDVDAEQIKVKKLLKKDFLELSMKAISSANPNRNMSWFTPAAHPGEKYFIFGKDGGKHLAESLGVELLGQIPLVAGICRGGDDGVPVTLQNSVSGASFMQLARTVAEAVNKRNATLPPTHKVDTH